jgi:hypothetical protein
MGNNRKTGSDTLRQPQALPIERDYVAEVQQRAEKLAQTAADSGAQTDRTGSRRQYRNVQEEMARLRSEAIQARRLAEQIEMVSLQNQPSQGTQDMVQASKQNSATSRGPEQGTREKAPAGGNRMAFNPLHPSMELPPEQLIRLLGLETKKTRKKDTRQARKRPETPVPRSAGDDTKPSAQLPPPIRPQRSRAAAAHTRTEKSRSGLFLPAIAVGVLAGVAASGYFFWYQDGPVVGTPPTASAVSAPVRKPPQPADLATAPVPSSKRSLPESVASKPAVKPATPAVAGTVHRAAPPASMASGANDPAWHAAAEAERQRLRVEAEQRFAQRLRQHGAAPVPAKPADFSASPAPVQPEYPLVAEPEPVSNPPPQEPGAAVEPVAPFASEPEAISSPTTHALEPVADTPFAVQPHNDPAPLAPASEEPAEAVTDIPTENSPVMFQEPATAQPPQAPPEPAGAGTGLEPLPDPTGDTPLASPQAPADPAALRPADDNPDLQAPEPLIAAPAPRADANEQDVEAAAPAFQAGEPDERDAAAAEPGLF